MLHNRNDRQKSLKRRFLLILGVVTFILLTTAGLMIMFWDKLAIPYTPFWRKIIGGVFIAYALFRVARVFRKEPDDEE